MSHKKIFRHAKKRHFENDLGEQETIFPFYFNFNIFTASTLVLLADLILKTINFSLQISQNVNIYVFI